MKKLILIAIILWSGYLLKAQFCDTPYDTSVARVNSSYVYGLDAPVKTIRVNFHFLLKSDGTGNFTETSDNYTNLPYNGYLFAEDIITWCNNNWNANALLQHMPIPQVPALQKKIQFQLCGVFFHRNTALYDLSANTIPSYTYAENSGEVINVFFTKSSGGGAATGVGGTHERARIGTAYNDYKASIDNNSEWRRFHYTRVLVNHEVGHLLGLNHPILKPGGSCCNDQNGYCDDGCDDTPTWQELKAMEFVESLICEYNDPNGSNNLMDYNASMVALSPCQISKIHECIDGVKKYYRNCIYQTLSLDITNFTDSKAYVAKSVTIPSTSNIVVDNSKALYINAEEFTINGEFEVQTGSIFCVDIVPACD